MAAVKLRTARMRLIVKELILLFLTVVQARWYTGYGGYGDHGVYGGYGGHGGQGGYGGHVGYYFQNLNHNGPSNPFGSSSRGLALNPHYAYSRGAFQDYKYQQVKYTPYRSAPDFDFGHDENKGKHYCPADRPYFIRRGTGRGKGSVGRVRGQCVDSSFCDDTAYNPREEACCPESNQFFNLVTYKCELCSVGVDFNPITQQCCPASNPSFFGATGSCGTLEDFCNSLGVDFNPITMECCPANNPEFVASACRSPSR